MSSNRALTTGFTIVELLIVIVVIGILAAVTVVAYNGITARAYNSSVAQYVASIEKSFKAYKAATGSYPPFAAGCLGAASDYPAATGFASGECVSGTNGTVQTTLTSQLSAYASVSVPQLKAVAYSGTQSYRGVYVISRPYTANDAYIEFMLPGDTSCPKGTKRIENGNTFCWYVYE